MGKRKKYPKNWAGYNFAQKIELPLFLDLVRIFVRNLDVKDRWKGNGRPPVETRDAIRVLLLWLYYDCSARKAVSRIEAVKEKVDLEKVPHFNVFYTLLEDEYLQECMLRILEEIFKTINPADKILATDSTGKSTSVKKFWNDWKGKRRKSKEFVKMHSTFGTKTSMIATVTVTKSKGKGTGDSTQLILHTERVKQRGIHADEWTADGAFCTRDCATAIRKTGAVPFIRIKKNATTKKKGSTAFRDMVKMGRKHPIIYRRHYHRRSKSESGFYSHQCRFSNKVRSKNFETQKGELVASCAVHNALRFSHAVFEFGITPSGV